MIYQTVTALAILASASANLASSSPESLKLMFENFKQVHGKRYASMDEEVKRFNIFVENLKLVDARNAAERVAGGSAVHGVTKFSDLSADEFKTGFLTYKRGNSSGSEGVVPAYKGEAGLVDWTGKYTTPVKDQGYCGSCWAFAASEQIESDAMRQLGVTYTLSPEQLVDCAKTSLGCNGGTQESAYNYVSRNGGIEQESTYPYTAYNGKSGSCSANSNEFVLGVSKYYTLTGESKMASYVKSTGPVSIAIDASDWSSYTGGIVSSCGTNINHAVQAVGVDDSTGGYWKVRNSWSATWGEAGYIRLAYGKDMCGITSDVTYVDTKKV